MTLIDNPTWTLVDRLRKSRVLADLDQTQIAERLGVARNTVSNWETGRSEPSATMFVRWARAVGVSLEWLAEGVNDEAAPTEVEAARSDVARPKGLEPLTFWFGSDHQFWTVERLAELDALARQLDVDTVSAIGAEA